MLHLFPGASPVPNPGFMACFLSLCSDRRHFWFILERTTPNFHANPNQWLCSSSSTPPPSCPARRADGARSWHQDHRRRASDPRRLARRRHHRPQCFRGRREAADRARRRTPGGRFRARPADQHGRQRRPARQSTRAFARNLAEPLLAADCAVGRALVHGRRRARTDRGRRKPRQAKGQSSTSTRRCTFCRARWTGSRRSPLRLTLAAVFGALVPVFLRDRRRRADALHMVTDARIGSGSSVWSISCCFRHC